MNDNTKFYINTGLIALIFIIIGMLLSTYLSTDVLIILLAILFAIVISDIGAGREAKATLWFSIKIYSLVNRLVGKSRHVSHRLSYRK